MPKITIEIDEEIYKFLQKQAISFEEKEPNDVLRRLLLKKDIENKNQDLKVFVRKSEINFPVLPGGVPKALEHILQVVYLVKSRKMSRMDSTRYLAKFHKVCPTTIADKYTRQLDLTAGEFDHLVKKENIQSLKNLLHRKFPEHCRALSKYFEDMDVFSLE
jgi:negative regulator of replication initiation